VGVAIAVTLSYSTGALLLPVAAVVVWQGRGANPSWRRTMAGLCSSFALALLPAAIVVALLQGRDNWGGLSEMYLGGDRYGVLRWNNIPRGLYAALRMLVLFPGLG